MDDGELAGRAKQGDIDAYETLLRRYQADAQRAAYLVTRHREDAEDAVQVGFVRAWDALESFDPQRPFRPWLLKIVTNQARDQIRATMRREKLRLRAATEAPVRQSSPEREVVTEARLHQVIDEINRMPDADRVVLAFRYFLDLPTAEIAEALGMADGTVRSRISRATRRLRERLAARARDDERASTARWKRPDQ